MGLAKTLASFWMRLMGMRIEYPYPLPAKCVIAVVPHTSNWDFPIGICVRPIIGEKIHFVAKDSLFRGPFEKFFRWMGGVPVDRSKNNNFVQAVADVFEKRDRFRLTVAPEGTRAKVDQLKSGFYYIALRAKVPIVLCVFDWGKGVIRFDKPFMPTGDKEADFKYFYEFYGDAKGFHPKKSFIPKS
ncbi:1-acyl-sn-glycerol-3-phosphate acyltransferase [Lewinella cohaerens]|uniref:1-acyl-sn-glycerol-3-phosphate acyltransferase n=1 Tax=Lewinella cohaerens TaxID=70995 RepID=UPI001B7F9C07|nr:1-acyl-sn-glycerol-3-phosphate acyltransferase [Lewinella cohaerens]